MPSLVLFNYVMLFFVLTSGENDTICNPISPCECRFSSGFGISLASLNNLINYTSSDGKLTYLFHPCSDVPIGNQTVRNGCIGGATLCLFDATTSTYSKLGHAKDVTFTSVNMSYPFTMTYTVNNVTSAIRLECSFVNNSFLQGLPVNTSYHELTFTSNLACPEIISDAVSTTPGSTTSSPDHSSRGLSTGSVLVILFFVISALYFIGGALALKFLRGASGKEMIPNYDFWVDLPYLCRDGILYVLYGCKVPPSYERI